MTRSHLDDLQDPEEISTTQDDEMGAEEKAEKERERAQRQRGIMEKMYFQLTNEQLTGNETGPVLLLNMFEQWDAIRSDIRDEIVYQVCRALAKTPRAPVKLAEKLISDIYEAVQAENVPDHPQKQHRETTIAQTRKNLPPAIGSDEYNQKVQFFLEKIGKLREKIEIVCDQFDVEYQMWLMNRETSEMVHSATAIQISDQPGSDSSVPFQSGIRSKNTHEDAADDKCPYARIRRDSATMRRVLAGNPIPRDMRKDGTTDEDPEE